MINFALQSATSCSIKGLSLLHLLAPACQENHSVGLVSDTVPPQQFDTKQMVPDGVIAIKNLTVLFLAYQATRLGIRSQDPGLPDEYSLVHRGFFAACRHKLAFTNKHYTLLTATDTTALYKTPFLCVFFLSI